jgi:hypothetical protein
LHQSTFISRRQNSSPSWAVWRLHGPMVFILAYYCLYRWMWYLRFRGLGIAPKDEPDLWRSTIFSEVLADFFWFSHESHWV